MEGRARLIWLCMILWIISLLISCKTAKIEEEIGLIDMAKVLNNNIPEFSEVFDSKGFYVKNGKPINFFVYDLIDTITNEYPNKQKLVLKSPGIYHFSPVRFRYSYSHIAVITNNELELFGFINCEEQGRNIDDVVSFADSKDVFSDKVIERLPAYRDFGKYYATDPQTSTLCN